MEGFSSTSEPHEAYEVNYAPHIPLESEADVEAAQQQQLLLLLLLLLLLQ